MDVAINKKTDLVVKSNRLIEASYRLTLAEQRIILFAIAEARRTRKGLSADDFVTIQATDYAAMFDVPIKQAYEQIKEAALSLYERGFVLYDTYPTTGEPRTIRARWVSAASYIDGAGAIQLQFSGVIVPYITHLEAQFTRYKLEKVAKMSSAYAIRLYELLMQWGSVGKREIELEWLRKILMVDQDYKALCDFKKRVIDVALSQINQHSDLTVRYTQRKTGRTVTHLTFIFAPKENAQAQPAERVRRQEAEAKRTEQDRSRREREARAEAQAWFEALPAAEQQVLEAAFLAEANTVDAERFRAKGRCYTGFRLFVQRTRRETRPA